ncbi:hypothetical protein SAMN05421752_102157 [Natronorubrum thiooxidans]|uniref:Uncharacterized protein n=1 Tax=Natronorubrum thiooxidans TaxID=308853 RepID=A0A1N7DCQ9_9EURY|nr:hypothetical protein SAMN05421752_102157 [Natronorubrum thiooxidans]
MTRGLVETHDWDGLLYRCPDTTTGQLPVAPELTDSSPYETIDEKELRDRTEMMKDDE